MQFMPALADGQIDPLGLHAGFRGGGLHAFNRFRNHFQANIVAQQYAYLQHTILLNQPN